MRKACSLLVKIAGLLPALAALALTAPVMAQDYPSKPVRLIIPFPPGGSNDVVGRMIALQLSDRLGKQVVVDNRGGAGGVIGTEQAANALPDGYTLLIISIAHAVSPWLYKLNYDPIKSFVPVSILASGTNVLVVHPSLPVHSVGELIALAKREPGELNYASAGIGSFQHLGGELFKLLAGVNIVHVPYKGGGPAMTDVVGGHTKIMFSSLVQTTGFVLNGQLRALGTGGAHRSPVLPDVPTIAEAGRARLRSQQLVGRRGARRHAARDRGKAAQGDLGGAEFRGDQEAVRDRRRRDRADELGRVRRLHGERNGQVGARRQGKRHQGRVRGGGLRHYRRQGRRAFHLFASRAGRRSG